MWHHPCQRCKYITSRFGGYSNKTTTKQNNKNNKKRAIKLVIHVEPHAQWVCSRERRIALYKRSSVQKTKQTNKKAPPSVFWELWAISGEKYNLQLLKFDDKHTTTGAEHFNHCTLFRSSSLFLHCSLLLFYLFLCLSVSVSVSLSLSLSVSLCLSVCLSLSFFLSLCLSFSLSKRRTLACSVKGTHEVIEICTQTHSK